MKLYQRKMNDPAPAGQADPYILKAEDGRYYIYATGAKGPSLFSSNSLLEGWAYEGECLDMTGQKSCWAPCVVCMDGKYYMYYSSLDADTQDVHQQTLRVAVSASPRGPFRMIKKLLPPFSIDPHVVVNGSGIYHFYCGNVLEAERVGTHIFCDRMTDPITMEGNPVCVVKPTLDEEIFMRNRFKKGEHWHTVEGAFYFHVGQTHFLMFSGANYTNPTYFIGYCVAHGPEDADLRTLTWKKYPDEHTYAPLLCNTDYIEGMGHNSVIFDKGEYYIVYHGRDAGDAGIPGDTRCARIDRMIVDGEVLRVELTR
ncbi:MAG: family 43 glycosylhydrolase [Lachnospiraceae bacterium]|nr:family 43 glycosylhydrolase [Lachnospiraceae bacterium]